MSNKINPIHQLVQDAINDGKALSAKEIRALRAQSQKAATLLKSIFWVGIVIFNLALWFPLPFEINRTLLYVIAFAALVIALAVPIPGLRKHHVNLELLKVNKQPLKKKTASEAGKVYIDKVKQQERPFINAEFELLDGSKWSGKAEE
jgi:hypothetical protein